MSFQDTSTTVLSIAIQKDPDVFPIDPATHVLLGSPGNSHQKVYEATKSDDFNVTEDEPMLPDKSSNGGLPGRKLGNISWRVQARGAGISPIAVTSTSTGAGPGGTFDTTITLPANHPIKVGQYVWFDGLEESDQTPLSLNATQRPGVEHIFEVRAADSTTITVRTDFDVETGVAQGSVFVAPSWHAAMVGAGRRGSASFVYAANVGVTLAGQATKPVPGEQLTQTATTATARLMRWDGNEKLAASVATMTVYDVDETTAEMDGTAFTGDDSGADIVPSGTATPTGIVYVPDDAAPACALALYSIQAGTGKATRYQISAAQTALTLTQESPDDRPFLEFDYQGVLPPEEDSTNERDYAVVNDADVPTGMPYETTTAELLHEVKLTTAEKTDSTDGNYSYGVEGGESHLNIGFARAQYVSNDPVEPLDSQNHKGGVIRYDRGKRSPTLNFDPFAEEDAVEFARAAVDDKEFPIHQIWPSSENANTLEVYWPAAKLSGAPLGDRSDKRTYELEARIKRHDPTGYNDMFLHVTCINAPTS